MAGVPLLNGFLSKEMFFAESIVAGNASGLRFTLPDRGHARGRIQRRVFLAVHSSGVLRSPFAETCRACRREPTRGMLFPSAVLVVACLLVGIMPAQTVGPLLDDGRAVDPGRRAADV